MKVVITTHADIITRTILAPLIMDLQKRGLEVELWYDPKRFNLALLEKFSFIKRPFPFKTASNPFRLMHGIVRLYLAMRREKPDALHANFGVASTLPLLAAYLAGIKVRIYHCHGFSYFGHHGLLGYILKVIEYINITLCSDLITVSHSNLEKAYKDGLIGNKPAYCVGSGSDCGIDLRHFSPKLSPHKLGIELRQSLGISENDFVVGYAGRPVKRKGFDLMLSVWSRFSKGKNTHLLLAGANPADCLRVLGAIPKNVHCLGFLSDVRPFYQAIDLLSLPSFHEGFPNVILEAAAFERPTVGSDIPGISSAIVHGKTGVLFKTESQESLLSALDLLYSKPGLIRELGAQAQIRCHEKFEREAFLDSFFTTYSKIIGIDFFENGITKQAV